MRHQLLSTRHNCDPVTPTQRHQLKQQVNKVVQTGVLKLLEGDSRVPMNDDVPATSNDGSNDLKTVDGVGTHKVKQKLTEQQPCS